MKTKRTRRVLLAFAATAGLHGCSNQDPDQPAMGSISVNAKPEGDGLPAAKKAAKPLRSRK